MHQCNRTRRVDGRGEKNDQTFRRRARRGVMPCGVRSRYTLRTADGIRT